MLEVMVKDNQMMKAEYDVQIATAKMYPRAIEKCIQEAKYMATLDQETAESCIYALPRGKEGSEQKFLKGPSVRLAEIMKIAWGNIHTGSRISGNDGKNVTAEAVAWDLERNVKVIKECKRSIVGKFGIYKDDMQNVTGMAAMAIATRNAVFDIIPQAFVKLVYDAAVRAAIGDQKTMATRVNDLLARFTKLGVPTDRILLYFDKKNASELDMEDVEEMIGIGNSVKDKVISVDKAFIKDVSTNSRADVDDAVERLNKNSPIN